MAKITGMYKITIPNIPISTTEMPMQKPFVVKKGVELIKIYPPGYNCEKIWKRIQGKHYSSKVVVSQENVKNADSLYILIEKDGNISNNEEAEIEYKKLDIEVENLASKILRLFRKQIPNTPITMPKQLLHDSLCKNDFKSQRNTLWSRTSRSSGTIYQSSQKYLDHEKWIAFKKALRNNEDTEIWEDFLYDAKASLEEDDLRKAILYASIGYEIFIKEYTEKAAKNASISTKFWKYLKNRQPRVIDYYDSILHLTKGHSIKEKPDWDKLLGRFNTARNKLVHEGKLILSITEKLQLEEDIKELDQVISWVSALD